MFALEILLIILIIGLLASAISGPRLGWWSGGLVSVVLVVLAALALIWLLSAVAGSG